MCRALAFLYVLGFNSVRTVIPPSSRLAARLRRSVFRFNINIT